MPALGLIPNAHLPDKRIERNQLRFLAAYQVYGRVDKASKVAGVERGRHSEWMRQDPTYSARFEQAKATALQSMEDEMIRRAHEGIRKPVLHQGKHVTIKGDDGVPVKLYEHEYDSQLLMFALKAMAPHKYNPPRETINLLELDPDLLTSAQLDKLLDHLIVKMVGNDPEAIEAARRDLAAGPAPLGTPASRVREAAEQLQAIVRRFDAVV